MTSYFIFLSAFSLDGKNWILPVVIFGFVIFYYFVIVRPQSKKEKEIKNRLNNLQKGDKVVTIGGIHGKISSIKEGEVVLKVDSNTEITFEKTAIARFIDNNPSHPPKKSKKDEQIVAVESTDTENKEQNQ